MEVLGSEMERGELLIELVPKETAATSWFLDGSKLILMLRLDQATPSLILFIKIT